MLIQAAEARRIMQLIQRRLHPTGFAAPGDFRALADVGDTGAAQGPAGDASTARAGGEDESLWPMHTPRQAEEAAPPGQLAKGWQGVPPQHARFGELAALYGTGPPRNFNWMGSISPRRVFLGGQEGGAEAEHAEAAGGDDEGWLQEEGSGTQGPPFLHMYDDEGRRLGAEEEHFDLLFNLTRLQHAPPPSPRAGEHVEFLEVRGPGCGD